MGDFFEKLGIYDLLAVLLSGACIVLSSVFTIVFIGMISLEKIKPYLKNDYSLIFLIASYFIGLIFQELSSFLHRKIFCRKDKLLERALKISTHQGNHTHEELTREEFDSIRNAFLKESYLSNQSNNTVLYAYCKARLISDGKMGKADRDQAIAGMSRSLSLYYFLLSCALLLLTLCHSLVSYRIAMFCSAILFLLVSVLLYERYCRFAKMRYIEILRGFYSDFVQKQKEGQAR